MGKAKVSEDENAEQTTEESTPEVENFVTEHLDRDPNDPRLRPTVDGNDQPKVDINVPVE